MPLLSNPPQHNDRKILQTININKSSSIKLCFEGYLSTAMRKRTQLEMGVGVALTPLLVIQSFKLSPGCHISPPGLDGQAGTA